MHNNDHHNKPPFCWCHDDTIPAEVFEIATTSQPDAALLEPQDGDEDDDAKKRNHEQWERWRRQGSYEWQLDSNREMGREQRARLSGNDPDPEPEEDEPGEEYETYVTTWGELLYLMTQGEMGTKPSETPRRYEPPRQPPPQR